MLTFIISYLAVFIISDYKTISTIHIALVSPSLRQTSAPIQFAIVLGVLGTQETLCYLVAGLLERDHLRPTPGGGGYAMEREMLFVSPIEILGHSLKFFVLDRVL